MTLPRIIQGGMGVAISDWRLAQAVSSIGHLGVVSGTGIAVVFSSRLQQGDPGGHMRRALAHFPFQDAAQRILNRYYVEGGIPQGKSYRRPTQWSLHPKRELVELTVIANFAEVFLAKEGHANAVGINLLEKVQMPAMASLYGAMLAGVDYVLIGAGIPMQIPGILDRLALHQSVSYRLDVSGSQDDYLLHFDPVALYSSIEGTLKRPQFLPIISSVVLAQALLKRATGRIDGFIVETPVAGGHNAPPRGALILNDQGEPVYGEKDVVDLEKLKALGLPFWLAGGYASPEKLVEALELGAAGIQVGTAFAYCDESGMEPAIKQATLQQVLNGGLKVYTSTVASPTGFPFKVVQMKGTLSDPAVYEQRERICDIGYLRENYVREDGKLGFRCAAESIDSYLKKGGIEGSTHGRACLCNCLIATAGYGQRHDGSEEPMMLTSGDDLPDIARFVQAGLTHYSATDVINELERLLVIT